MDEKKLRQQIRSAWKVFQSESGDSLQVEVYREVLFTTSNLRAKVTLRRGHAGVWGRPIYTGSKIMKPDGQVLEAESPVVDLTDREWMVLGEERAFQALYFIETLRSIGEEPDHVLSSLDDIERLLRQSQET